MVQRGNFLLILQCRQAPPPFRGASETERSQRSPSQNDTDVAGWRRVSCWSRRGALGPSSPARRRILAADPIGTNKPSTSAASHRPLPHTAPHKLLAQVEHPAGRSRMLVAVHGLALRSASDAIRAPLTELLKPDGCRAPPVARIAPPAPAIISASRARVGERYGTTREFSADPSVPPGATTVSGRERDRAQSAVTIPERHGCRWVAASVVLVAPRRVGTIIAGAAPNPRRRPIGTNKPSTSAAADHPIATHSAAQAAGAGRAPRRSISHARRCPRARAALSERCHQSPPHRIVETGWLSRATP